MASQDGSKAKCCVLSQQQSSQQTRQRALAIELRPDGEGAKGTLVLLFGLALVQGIAYQLDQGAVGAPQPFRTCLPAECLVDVAFDPSTVASLKGGNVLSVKATAADGPGINSSIPLTGFASAYERVVALAQ